MLKRPVRAVLLLGCIGLLGCAGERGRQPVVKTTGTGNRAGTNAPSIIYVTDFYLPPEMIQQAQTLAERLGVGGGGIAGLRQEFRSIRGDDPVDKAKELVKILGQTIASDLNKAGYSAQYRPNKSGLRQEFFPADADLPKKGWLMGGWFEQVQEPNRAEEAAVGFGAGSGKVSIQVVVSDLATNPREPFLFIGTQNGQERMPGGIIARNPYAMAAKFVLERGQTERDVRAMGSAIAKTLVQYLQDGAAQKSE